MTFIVEQREIDWRVKYSFIFYTIIVVLNLGGFLTSFYAINIFYFIVPVSVLISLLFSRFGPYEYASFEFSFYWYFVCFYLLVSCLSFFVISYNENFDIVYSLRTFFYSIINVFIYYRITIIYRSSNNINELIRTFLWLFLIAMVLTAMFPYFNITPLDYKKASDSLMSLTHSYSIRLTGFYLNPNLTGYISNIALVFALTSFLSIKKLNYLSIGLLFLSIYVSLRSFSKTSIIITLLILLLFFAFILFSRSFWFSKQLSNKRRFLFIVVLILFGVIIKGNLWLKDLDEGQRDRLSQVFSILVSGEFNKKTTTYRSEIWETGVVKIFESPFIGNGYGSFDYFEEEGQGIHNMFLKMFGEAGIFVGIVYLIFHLVVLRYIVLEREYSYKFMLMGLFLSTVIFNLSNHNAFQTYLISMVYGLILAFSYVQK